MVFISISPMTNDVHHSLLYVLAIHMPQGPKEFLLDFLLKSL